MIGFSVAIARSSAALADVASRVIHLTFALLRRC
jgi:hypothetical protein